MIAAFLLFAAEAMTFTADRIAADNVTKALAATGHIHAKSGAITLRGESIRRDADGRMTFADPTCVTTCSNDVGHTHWNVTGEVEYRAHDAVILRDAWLRFYEVPIFWFPYLYYPLETDCGFSWMPGYTKRWGGYLLTKYVYHVAGDLARADNTWWLDAATRFDMRWEQGLALGEDLKWNLGDFGHGKFRFYYAWDQDAEDRYAGGGDNGYYWNSQNWGSEVGERRYGLFIRHVWEMSERDIVRFRGNYQSDTYFQMDFFRQRQVMFNWKNDWLGQDNSGVFWEHLEDLFSVGAEVSGRLNKFYEMVGRLPEIYADVNPMPVFGLPVNYETENRIGWLRRDTAEYGSGWTRNAYSYNPGVWAEYETFRFDTYHRLTAPFRFADDLISAVPRIGFHGTYWNASGSTDLTGARAAENRGAAFRSILEGGATFAGRGTGFFGDFGEVWEHVTEPYLDVLCQRAWYSGLGGDDRPYVFDNLDASRTWEDQFAGRSRNLPYSYYGVTPGWRNVWHEMNEHGTFREVFDLDVYGALQANPTSWQGTDESTRLAEVGKPNYGKRSLFVPGARLRWSPFGGATLGARTEYDTEDNCFALGSVKWSHVLSESFKYNAAYSLRDHRWWDYSRFSDTRMNTLRLNMVSVGFEHQVCDWLAWGPAMRWDCREGELDAVSTWIDYLTDCLGFRLILEYDSEFTMVDGYTHEEDFSVGFYVYLRCFGPESGGVFSN